MSDAMTSIFCRQAIAIDYQGESILCSLGRNRLPRVVVEHFKKTDFCRDLEHEGKISFDSEHGDQPEELQRKARHEAAAKLQAVKRSQLPGPSELVGVQPITRDRDGKPAPGTRWELVDRTSEPIGKTFDTELEAEQAAETRNDAAWSAWLDARDVKRKTA